MDHRARAHRAWLKRRYQRASCKAVVPDSLCRPAQCHQLCMGRRVVVTQYAVLPSRDDSVVEQNHGADRHLTGRLGGAGLAQRLSHQFQIRHLPFTPPAAAASCSAARRGPR